jgi:hypothetical protein
MQITLRPKRASAIPVLYRTLVDGQDAPWSLLLTETRLSAGRHQVGAESKALIGEAIERTIVPIICEKDAGRIGEKNFSSFSIGELPGLGVEFEVSI